jgi:AAA ATPase domain
VPDWNLLRPYAALAESEIEALYEPRPADVALDLAGRVRAGFGSGRIALNGPAGVGKSTELARAALELRSTHSVGVIALDGGANTQPEQLLWEVLGALVPDDFGRRDQRIEHSIEAGVAWALKVHGSTRRLDQILDTISFELRSQAERDGRPQVVLIDGLERVLATARAQELLLCLADAVDRAGFALVVVLSPWAISGAQGSVVADRFKVLDMRPVAGTAHHQVAAQAKFMLGLARRRLGVADGDLPLEFAGVWGGAAHWSGGLPRLFLQLLGDASAYAALRGAHLPTTEDLQEAVADHRDSLRMLLELGDLSALNDAGRGRVDIDAATRARLLASGLLLELPRGSVKTYIVHPLASDLVQAARRA